MDLLAPRRAVALGIAALAFLATASPAVAALGDRTLRPGSQGADVKALQRTLTQLSLRTPADGHFGTRTTENVRRYERRARLKVDGVVGRRQAAGMRRRAESRRRRSATPPAPAAARFGERSLQRGMRGDDVKVLQQTLTRLGFPAGADGVFGAETERQLRAWEAKAGLTTDGVVDKPQATEMTRRAAAAPTSPPAPSTGSGTFPVRGAYSFGGAGALFGAPRAARSHQGQDISAACGTPLVSAEAGSVLYAGYQGDGAGYYVVVQSRASNRSLAYMHMLAPSLAATGAEVARGQALGAVGNSGRSFGCHLHFELWSAPGWYRGGAAIDPLPSLRAWAAGG